MESSSEGIQALLRTATEIISTWGLRVVGALALLVVGWIVAKGVRAWVRRTLGRSSLDPTLIPFCSGLTYYALLTFLGLAVLSLFGIQTASFVAVIGAAGLAIGLALQGTLTNFASGVMLLIFRPFRVGGRRSTSRRRRGSLPHGDAYCSSMTL